MELNLLSNVCGAPEEKIGREIRTERNGTPFLEVEIASKELKSNNCLLLAVLDVTEQSRINNGLLFPSTLHAHFNVLYLLVLQVDLRKRKEQEEVKEKLAGALASRSNVK